MAWSSQNTGFPYYSNYWQYNNAVSGIQRTSVNPTSYGRLTYLLPSYYTFKSDKTYQYEIEVQGNFTGVGMSASYQWTGNNPYDKIIGTNSGAGGRYYFYSSPTSDVTTLYSIYLSATGSLSGNTPNVSPSIVNLKLTEIDWLMSGTKRYNTGTNLTIDNVNYNGWSYQKSTDAFYWTNKPDPIMVSSNDPIIINSEFNGNANGWTLGFPYSPTQSATTYSAGTIVFGATGIGWLAQDVFGG